VFGIAVGSFSVGDEPASAEQVLESAPPAADDDTAADETEDEMTELAVGSLDLFEEMQ
jgi:hypothetical protein